MELREMLELAALAAGVNVVFDDKGTAWKKWPSFKWNPADDDGDSRRLEVALNMLDGGQFQRLLQIRLEETLISPTSGDDEILRMAVLRCAAEMGLSMREKSND